MLLNVQHVYPQRDIRQHITDYKLCWCNPIVAEQQRLVIHFAADGREFFDSNDLNDRVPIFTGTPHFIFFQGSTSH